jgi:peroxiredoxin (alkyl hydroperoxide reductase subunit C)
VSEGRNRPPEAGPQAVSVIEPGAKVPEFAVKTDELEDFTQADLVGRTSVLVFYPGAFSPVCTDQLQVYEEVVDELRAQGVDMYGVSCDGPFSQKAFRESLNITIPQLSDFEPKGAMSRAFGAYIEQFGFSDRAIVIVGPDGTVVWSHVADSPGDIPGVNLIVDALAARG